MRQHNGRVDCKFLAQLQRPTCSFQHLPYSPLFSLLPQLYQIDSWVCMQVACRLHVGCIPKTGVDRCFPLTVYTSPHVLCWRSRYLQHLIFFHYFDHLSFHRCLDTNILTDGSNCIIMKFDPRQNDRCLQTLRGRGGQGQGNISTPTVPWAPNQAQESEC